MSITPENKTSLSKQQQLEKILLNKNTLEHMNRDKLVTLAKDIGITQTLNSPYKKKEDIINLIEVKTIKRSKTKQLNSKPNKDSRETQRGGLAKKLSINTLNQIRQAIPYTINYDNLDLKLNDYYPKAEKIYVLGDIHGDLMATIESLKLALSIFDNKDEVYYPAAELAV